MYICVYTYYIYIYTHIEREIDMYTHMCLDI